MTDLETLVSQDPELVTPKVSDLTNEETDIFQQMEIVKNALGWLMQTAEQSPSEAMIAQRNMALTDATDNMINIFNSLLAHMSIIRGLTQDKAVLMARLAITQSSAIALRENAQGEARKQFIQAMAIALDLHPTHAETFFDVVTGREESVSEFVLDDLKAQAVTAIEDVLWTQSENETDTEGWGEDWELDDDDELG